MKLLFIIDQVYLHGGIERVLSIKANYFSSKKNNSIYILTTNQSNKDKCYDFNTNITFKDLSIKYNRKKSYFHPKNLLKLPLHIIKLKSTIRDLKPDLIVVCSHSVDTYFIPFIISGIPIVKEFHFSKFIEKEKRKNTSNILKKIFFKFSDYIETKYDKLIILNKDEAKFYNTNNIAIIPNPLTFFPDTVSKLENKTIITAGRIAPVKGYDYLIKIWQIVSKEVSDWTLNIYGEGEKEYQNDLQKTINNKGLHNSIFLKGSTNNMQKELLNSSIFVLSSHNECFPLVLLEAQACGLPIVSFDSPYGPRNIVNENNGILLPLYDIDQFANKLIFLIRNAEARISFGKNARENALHFSLEKVMSLWGNIFIDLIKNK